MDRPATTFRAMEKEFGLEEIYLCDQDGKPVHYATEFDGEEFTAYQCYDRKKLNRAMWPREEQLERVQDGTGAEVKEWILDQSGCETEILVIEGLKFRIVPLEEMPTPELKDWSRILVRNFGQETRH